MAGSAYTYGYATLGELFAWIIGWDLILEYAVGAITVAIGWSGYVVSFLHDFGIVVPPQLAAARGTELIDLPAALAAGLKMRAGWTAFSTGLAEQIQTLGTEPASLAHVTAIFNLPAVLIIFVVTTLLVVGIKESANFNNVIVLVKVAVVLLFIAGAAQAIQTANWHPFIPANAGKFGHFGWSGIATGALVFFAYIASTPSAPLPEPGTAA
jgi:APA family basic amino acid/polyamine antiporter